MRLTLQELKKLLRPGLCGAILVFLTIYCLLFALPYGFLPLDKQHDRYERYVIQTELIKQYGPRLGLTALEGLNEKRDAYYRLLDPYFAADANMQRRGVNTYEVMCTYEDDPDPNVPGIYEEYSDMMQHIPGEAYEEQTLYMAQAYRFLSEEVTRTLAGQEGMEEARTPQALARLGTLNARGWVSNMTISVFEQQQWLVQKVGLGLILASLLMSALLPTQDALRQVRPLQYASKGGRTLFSRQAAVTIAVSTLFVTLVFWGFQLVFIQVMDAARYFSCDISSNLHWARYWLDMTLLQYTAIEFSMTWALCLCTAMIGHVLGQFARNYIQMLAGLVPLWIAMNGLHGLAMEGLFSLEQTRPFLQPAVVAGCLLLCATLFMAVRRWDRCKRTI